MATPTSTTHRKSSLSHEIKAEEVSAPAAVPASSGSAQSPKTTFTLGSRSSQLALVQTHLVRESLLALHPTYTFPIITMTTAGDNTPLQALYMQQGKDLWTSELEASLMSHQIDIVVHSLKDVPTTLGSDFRLSGITERAEPRDALVMKKGLEGTYTTLEDLPDGSVVGTSSVRRVAQLRREFPGLKFMDMRGNLNTRLAKLDAPTSPFTALILAHAGLERINLGHRTTSLISPPRFHYAVGQGALGIETRAEDAQTHALVRKIVHWQTEYRVSAERACLRKLEGGCSVPVGVCSDLVESADGGPKLSLTGTVTSLDGKEFVVFTVESRVVNSVEEAEQVGLEVAEALIANGAARILKEIEISKRESGAVGSGLLEK